ncbi:MAG: hypothetical protein LBU77_00465, partial [Clostridiales bacterium]|nr:hypothetical protein [Clostridiales bacterium]
MDAFQNNDPNADKPRAAAEQPPRYFPYNLDFHRYDAYQPEFSREAKLLALLSEALKRVKARTGYYDGMMTAVPSAEDRQ